MKNLFLSALATASIIWSAQAQTNDSIPKKGSYLYFGQPSIEDNSMFIEEAFNQEAGIIQHISNFVFTGKNFAYNYTQEIPLADDKHQLSFGVSYASLQKPEGLTAIGSNYLTSGLGDIYVNYRPMLFNKHDWALVIPRFTLIVPTGNSRYGLGSGGWGGQFNMAVTKRISRKTTMHYNAGYTVIKQADYYTYKDDGTPVKKFEKDLPAKNIGASAIWQMTPKFNLMCEYVTTFGKAIEDDGSLVKNNITIINPGFRFAVDIGKVQIVPGLGVPINFNNGAYDGTGAFVYLSIEPAY